MKKLSFQLVLCMSACLLLASCSPKIPFTQNVRDKYKLSEEDLKRIQFYVSDAIVLKRGEEVGREKGTDNGALVIKSGKKEEYIIFKRNASCVVNKVEANKILNVGFEETPNNYLIFSSENDHDGYYVLKTLLENDQKRKVNYGDQYYNTDKDSQKAFLMFKMKGLRKKLINEKVIKGKKVKYAL